jgi:hypothetical protein
VSTAENPHAGQGSVVLDIGGDVGALVVTAPADLVGAEIEICPAGRGQDAPDEGGDWWQGEWRSARHEHAHPSRHAHTYAPAWPHVAVVRRPTSAGFGHAAVFPALRNGAYELRLRPHGTTAMVVTVTGGSVTAATWP